MVMKFFTMRIFFRNGYRIDYDDWIDLLKYLGYEVEYKEISDEEVEEL